MFRECYFEYAGVSSQSYNLILAYLDNSNEDFDSGGGFELKKDTLPRSHETLLYGKDYSANPLTFEVEIINTHDYIPDEQMIEIKNWLFGQDGWKTLVLYDSQRINYCLKCVFEPGDDIVDGSGYKGIRCTLHNISPFWYGEEQTITFTHSQLKANISNGHPYWYSASTQMSVTRPYGVIDIYIPESENIVDFDIYPIITATDSRGDYTSAGTETYTSSTDYSFCISNTSAESIADGMANDGVGFEYPDTSRIAFRTDYISTNDTFKISSRYAYIQSLSPAHRNHQFKYHAPKLTYFKLHKGHNICRILEPTLYSSINISYMPVYRMGAF